MIKRKLLVGCCLTIGLMLAGCGDKEVSNQSATTTQVETTTEAETTTEVETTTEEETSTEEEVTTGVEDETTEAPTEPVTEESTESITEAVKPTEAPTTEAVKPTEAPTQKPTEAPTTKPVETQAPTQAPVETQPPTQAPTQAPDEEPTLGYVISYEEMADVSMRNYLARVNEPDNLTTSGDFINSFSATRTEEEIAEATYYAYELGLVDWNAQAAKVAMARWDTAHGYTKDDVKEFLIYLGFSESEAEYGATEWAKNPPAKTEIDWFELAYSDALDSMNNGQPREYWIGGANDNLTMDEIIYALNRTYDKK